MGLTGTAVRIARQLGLVFDNISHTERLVSTIGGVLGIFCISVITRASLDSTGTLLIVPSMGAAAD